MAPPRSIAEDLSALLQDFSVRLNALLDGAGYPRRYAGRVNSLADIYGVSSQTARKWLGAKGLPNPVTLLALARDLHVSVDYLLTGTACTLAPEQYVGLPVYVFSGHVVKAEAAFVEVSMCLRARTTPSLPGLPPLSDHCAYVANWSDSDDPHMIRNDLALIDLDVNHIPEDGIYLVRTAALVSFRRIRQHLDGSVVVTRTHLGQTEDVSRSRGAITFNTRRDINATPSGNGLLILGRIVAIMRNADVITPS